MNTNIKMEAQYFTNNTSFIESFEQLVPIKDIEPICSKYHSGRGAPPKLTCAKVIIGLIYHFFASSGTFAAHIQRIFEMKISNSGLSQRRSRLFFEIFEDIMKVALYPLATEEKNPECFYTGYRLVSIDGTQFSAQNTSAILDELPKSDTRYGKAGYVKIGVSVLIEIGTHHPLGARIATNQESELALSERLLDDIPHKSLFIADRLYGTGATVSKIKEICEKKDSVFLIRVKSNLKKEIIKSFTDGSALVKVTIKDADTKEKKHIIVREIRGRVKQPGKEWSTIILWTNLLDAKACPAKEVLPLYKKRWEDELYFDQLKIDLHYGELLQSQTVETSYQEIAALILASAIVSKERFVLGKSMDLSSVRVSLAKTREHIDSLWFVMQAAGDVLTEQQKKDCILAVLEVIKREVILPPRRSRSCSRAVRQPIKKWPRLFETNSVSGPLQIEIIPISVP